MPVHSRRDYIGEAVKDPFQLELENGEMVTFRRPTDWTNGEIDNLTDDASLLEVLAVFLSKEDFEKAKPEFQSKWTLGETKQLIDDAREFYSGATKSAAE